MNMFNPSRRGFIKQCVIGGVVIYSAPMFFRENNPIAATVSQRLHEDWKGHGQPRYRYDAIEKVTGQKIYGRDYRAKDIAGWPDIQHYGFIMRANVADRIYLGLDLSILTDDIKPYKIITSKDLESNTLFLPEFFGDNMLLEENHVPDYLGHELAILLFDSFEKFQKAKNRIQFNSNVIKYGNKSPLAAASKDPYATWFVVREEGANGTKSPDIFSAMNNGLFFANYVDHKPVWPKPVKNSANVGELGMYYNQQLREEIENNEDEWFVLGKTFHTQSIEPMMFEPEAFNGWYDKANESLHVVITTQSPQDFYQQAGEVLAKSPLSKNIKALIVHSPYIGGGFGAKDHTIFPYYGLIASLFSESPVRIANDRFEQFQAGLKRHPFVMENKLAINKNTHKITGFVSSMVVDGGGRVNFSPSVTMVGVSAIQSIYYLPRNAIEATCYASDMPPAGSMRGYGTLQSMPTMEMMINEAAGEMNVDPFKLRHANAFVSGQKNTQGARPSGDVRYNEMLDMAEQHDIWVNRKTNKAKFEQANQGKKFGVGFGIVTKDYGTGANSPAAYVEITPEGKIVVKTISVEMGTGTATSQGALVEKYLGNMADTVDMAQIQEFDAMELFETDDPYFISQQQQDKMSQNPHWTPVLYMASSASQSGYFQSHATAQAARILFEEALYPAAVEILTNKYLNSQYAKPDLGSMEDARWTDGKLTIAGNTPLPLSLLAQKAHAMGLITGVMTHAFNRWAWAIADFDLNGKKRTFPLDAIAVKYGIGASAAVKSTLNSFGFQVIERVSVDYPATQLNNAMVTYYTPCATLAEIAVHEATGFVEILRTHTWLDPGHIHVNELVEGQLEGGVTMGIGHALYEYLPPGELGAGNGTWNLNRYQVPLSRHNGVWNIGHTFLPPLSDTAPAKGLGEVVMVPVVPAIVEAIYQAINTRFYHLPITPQQIVEAIKL